MCASDTGKEGNLSSQIMLCMFGVPTRILKSDLTYISKPFLPKLHYVHWENKQADGVAGIHIGEHLLITLPLLRKINEACDPETTC